MARILDDITLPDEIEWVDRYKWIPVQQSAEYTLGGNLVVDAALVNFSRPITLVAADEICWVPKTTVDALLALAAVPGEKYEFEWDGFVAHVVFALHNDQQAVAFDPLFPHDEEYFVGSIKLITVVPPPPE